ncbi:MAG TPA: hypothetical protein VMP67_01415 [Candidatus Limnocylindria bacterium]|nr:hypothetical protein [Candidatus Limnocylindria bacterium]
MKVSCLLLIAVVVQLFAVGACAQACPAALFTGQLVEQEGGELIALDSATGRPERIIWPFGFRLTREGERLAVVDGLGRVVAGEGDTVQLGGGERASGVWVVCGTIEVVAGTGASTGWPGALATYAHAVL